MSWTGWTTSELKVLREMYWIHGSRGVHTVLPHRSREAIRKRATQLGIKAYGKNGSWRSTYKRVI